MDGDDFSRTTKLGRAVAEAVIRAALSEERFDEFTTALLVDETIAASGGIASLPAILSILEGLRAEPLLVRTRVDEACARVNDAAHGADCGMLDLQLGSVAQSAIIRGQTDANVVLEEFMRRFIERQVITPRGGLVEIDGLRFVAHAQRWTAPVVKAAAAELIRRPDAQRLGLAKKNAHRITEQSDLLGGVE